MQQNSSRLFKTLNVEKYKINLFPVVPLLFKYFINNFINLHRHFKNRQPCLKTVDVFSTRNPTTLVVKINLLQDKIKNYIWTQVVQGP